MHQLGGGLAPLWWYTRIFLGDIEADTLNCAFNIPLDGPCSEDINYGLNKFDMVVVDEGIDDLLYIRRHGRHLQSTERESGCRLRWQ